MRTFILAGVLCLTGLMLTSFRSIGGSIQSPDELLSRYLSILGEIASCDDAECIRSVYINNGSTSIRRFFQGLSVREMKKRFESDKKFAQSVIQDSIQYVDVDSAETEEDAAWLTVRLKKRPGMEFSAIFVKEKGVWKIDHQGFSGIEHTGQGSDTTSTHDQAMQELLGPFSLFAGAGIPTGDFASTNGQTAGFAKPGFALGAQYVYPLRNSVLWSLSITASFNPMDESALLQAAGLPPTLTTDISSYSTIVPMFGMGFHSPPSSSVVVYGIAEVGLMFASSPDLSISSGSESVSQSSASAITEAYGFHGGLFINNRVNISLKYLLGQPKYKVTATGGGFSTTVEAEQPTGLLQLLAGITF